MRLTRSSRIARFRSTTVRRPGRSWASSRRSRSSGAVRVPGEERGKYTVDQGWSRRGEARMVGGTHIYGGFNISPYLAHRVFEAVKEITTQNLDASLSHVDDDNCAICQKIKAQ